MYQIRLVNQGLEPFAKAFKLEDLSYFGCLQKLENLQETKLNSISVLESPAQEHKAYVCGEVSTSFDLAHKLVELELFNDWDLVVAYSQNAGRGQLRSHWVSKAGNIYACLRLPNVAEFQQDEGTALLGKYLAQAFLALGIEVQTKWVNDLLIKKENSLHKVCGILLEERNNALIMGFGVNIHHAPKNKELSKETLYEPAKLLDITDKYPDPLALCLRLVENLILSYNNSCNT